MTALSGGTAELRALVTPLTQLAAEAGRLILGVSRSGFEIRTKGDSSPVTDADIQAEEMLTHGLELILPGVPILAEESASRGESPALNDTFLVIDPLDGTREYVSGRAEYTVNIGFVVGGRPVLGILAAPALGRFYWGVIGGGAARANEKPGVLPDPDKFSSISTRPKGDSLVALTSRGHNDPVTEAFLDSIGANDRQRLGSAYKFALIAEGNADLYARFGNTMEWDTAAGDAIVAAAGGVVLTPEGKPLAYGKTQENYRNGPFIAWGRPPR